MSDDSGIAPMDTIQPKLLPSDQMQDVRHQTITRDSAVTSLIPDP
jgi:hypothetical protein